MESIKMPEFVDFDYNSIELSDLLADAEEFSNLNEKIILTAMNLRDVNELLTKYTRERTKLQSQYKIAYRNAYLKYAKQSYTEKQKAMLSEMDCSDLEVKVSYLNQYVTELTNRVYQLRSELDILKTLGYNLRQEAKVY